MCQRTKFTPLELGMAKTTEDEPDRSLVSCTGFLLQVKPTKEKKTFYLSLSYRGLVVNCRCDQ